MAGPATSATPTWQISNLVARPTALFVRLAVAPATSAMPMWQTGSYFPLAPRTWNAAATAVPSDKWIVTGTRAPIFSFGVGLVHIR